MTVVRNPKARRQQYGQVTADCVVGVVAENLLRASVEMNDPPGLIHRDDRVGGDIENARKLCFRRSELSLNATLFSRPRANPTLLRDEECKRCPGDQRRGQWSDDQAHTSESSPSFSASCT